MYIGSWKIDDLLTFVANTQVFATGVATDADSPPAYRVYEDETGTAILTGSMALLDSTNTAGFYSEQITLSAANGFEKGKCYSIYISATVSSVAGATHRTFQIQAEVAVASMNANTLTASAVATDAVTEIQAGLATAAALTTVDDFLDTEVAAILAAVDTEVAAIKAKTDLIPGTQDGKTFAEHILLQSAVLLGKASGLATTTAVYRSVDDAHDRVTATVDADGNRSAVTYDTTSP